VRLGEAYGIESTRVYSREELLKAMERALKARRIQLIEVSAPKGFNEFC
jgi:thiamine pyrophosphate-dependent acetolactate synthase large subunit-like protein